MLVPGLPTGFHLVLHQPFDLSVFLSRVGSERTTCTAAPPLLLRSTDLAAAAGLSSVCAIVSGKAPLHPGMVDGWQDGPGIEAGNICGSHERGAVPSTPKLVPDPAERARFLARLGRPKKPIPAGCPSRLQASGSTMTC